MIPLTDQPSQALPSRRSFLLGAAGLGVVAATGGGYHSRAATAANAGPKTSQTGAFWLRQAGDPTSNLTDVALLDTSTATVSMTTSGISRFAGLVAGRLVDGTFRSDGVSTAKVSVTVLDPDTRSRSVQESDELADRQARELYGVSEQVLSPDGRYLATYYESSQLMSARGTKENKVPTVGMVRSGVLIWDTTTGRQLAAYQLPDESSFTAGTGGAICWAPDTQSLYLFVQRYDSGRLRSPTYHLGFSSGTPILSLKAVVERPDIAAPLSAPLSSKSTYCSSDGLTIAALRGNVLHWYDAASGRIVGVEEVVPMPVTRSGKPPMLIDIEATPDGRYALTVAKSQGVIAAYDLANRRTIGRLTMQNGPANQRRSISLLAGEQAAVIVNSEQSGGAFIVSYPNLKVEQHLASGTKFESVTASSTTIALRHQPEQAITTVPIRGGSEQVQRIPSDLDSFV